MGSHESACVRPCTRGAEERAVWLICPIKLLQTLPWQLLPAGPWVQIGSVSLPQGGVSGPESGGQSVSTQRVRSHSAQLGPCGPCEHLLTPAPPGSPGPLGLNVGAPCIPVCHPDPHGRSGLLWASLPFSKGGGFMLCKGCHVRKPSRAPRKPASHAPFHPRQ